jgi:cytoskeletal protein CcmA (bactofilin family)
MAKQMMPADPVQINMIGKGTVVEGTLRAKDDIRVSGRVKGSLHVEGKAIIANEGIVDGDVHAADADVAGKVDGELAVKGRLLLKSSARISGTIRTSRLVMEEGATFDGQCEMGQLEKSRAQALGNGSSSSGVTPAASPVGVPTHRVGS